MADFSKHIDTLIQKEGGYVLTDHPTDRGGKTYAGISERSNPNWEGWSLLDNGASIDLMYRAVKKRYFDNYWNPIRGHEIESDDIAELMFSCSVLSSPRRTIRLAQMAVEVKVDGSMGPNTIRAINEIRPIELFEFKFALARIARYAAICNRDRSQKANLLGWLNRVFQELRS